MHIPSVLGTNWQYQSLNEKAKKPKITVPKVELQADATDHLVKLQNSTLTALLVHFRAKDNFNSITSSRLISH